MVMSCWVFFYMAVALTHELNFYVSEELDVINPTMWSPRWIAKSVQITPITMVYGTYNDS